MFGGLKESIFGGNGAPAESAVNVAFNDLSLEDLIAYIDDKKVITEDALDAMMIERDTFKRLLVAVSNYNHQDVVATKEVEFIRTYQVKVPKVTNEGVAYYTYEDREERGYMPIEYHTAALEGMYPIDWQVIYSFATFYAMERYRDGPGDGEVAPEEFFEGDGSYYKTSYDKYFDEAAEATNIPVNLPMSLRKISW